MKYTIESTQTGCTEILEVDGRTYQKRTERTDYGCRSVDPEFHEQMETERIWDEEFLEKVYDAIENDFRALEFIELSEM